MRLLAIVLTCGLAGAVPAHAQPAAGAQAIPLSLDEAIARGMAASHRLAEMDARVRAADAAIGGARAAALPEVSLQGGFTRTNHVDEFAIATPGGPPQIVYPDVPSNARARFDLQWPIYTGGRTAALERAARAEHGASAADRAAARADLRLEITRAFWALVTARETEVVLQRALEAIGAHVNDLRERLAQGLIPPNDLLSAQAEESHQRMLAIEARNTRAIAEADLRRATGIDDQGRLEPVVDPSRDAAASEAVPPGTVRPERRALAARAQAAIAQADAAAAASRPQVAVGAGYDYARPNPRIFPRTADWRDSWDVSVFVSWPLWDGGRRAADRGEARALADAAQARVEDFDREARFEVRQRQLELDSSRASVTAAEDEVRAAAEAERVVGERYRAGVATSSDVLDAQVARLQAELDRTRATAGVRLAAARLARALGTEP
ncbi:MAG TPA: TolC family protein [Vicinamibacterales bacterium]|nr:TolC family protein [Vicinamibacterales bacterium]